MNMPGFTGETSLYKTRGHYCAMASTPTGLVGERVLPQLPIGWCMADCDEQYPWGSIDNWACKYGCVGERTIRNLSISVAQMHRGVPGCIGGDADWTAECV